MKNWIKKDCLCGQSVSYYKYTKTQISCPTCTSTVVRTSGNKGA